MSWRVFSVPNYVRTLALCIFQTESLVAMSLGAFKEKVGELMATGDYKVPVGFAFTEKWLLNYMKRFGLQMAPLSNGTSESPENSLEPAETDSDNAFTKPSTWSDDLLLYLAPSNSTKSISNQEGYGEEYSNDAEMTDATDRPAAVSLKPDQESSAKLGASGRKSESSRRRTNALNVRGRGVQHLSDEIRTALVEKHEKNPDWSQTQLAAWLKNEMGIAVHRATIGRNLRRSVAEKAEETSDSANATSKKTVNGHLRGLADLEEALHEWIKNERRNGVWYLEHIGTSQLQALIALLWCKFCSHLGGGSSNGRIVARIFLCEIFFHFRVCSLQDLCVSFFRNLRRGTLREFVAGRRTASAIPELDIAQK